MNRHTVTRPSRDEKTLRRRLRRTGVLVVGGSTAASVIMTDISFRLFGDVDYVGSMVCAVIIPLVVANIAYAWIASLTLRLDRSRAALDRLAHEDSLTGLANRRAALQQLADWSREPGATVLAIADLDHFKRVNDGLGHEGGDSSLVHLAGVLRRLVPPTWLVARIGGEEFLLAARNLNPEDFAARIEGIRTAVAITPLITPAGPWQLTASFGIAAQRSDEEPGRLMARADEALYSAKQAGRNRTERAA